MATEPVPSIALHLRSSLDDMHYVDAFRRAGVRVKPVNSLADAITMLDALAADMPVVFAIASAQHGGIALLELLSEVHTLSHVQVILIDPQCDVRTAIKALRLGATDYFTAGAAELEIQARLQFLLNAQAQLPALPDAPAEVEEEAPVTDEMLPEPLPDSISLNTHLRAIRKGDMWISLSPIEWRLFEELVRNRGRVVLFSELVRRALHRERVTPSETSLLRLHMSRLRAKLNAHFERELNIITLRGRGYMMV
jgi:DNA-binding response OmpR family regulator